MQTENIILLFNKEKLLNKIITSNIIIIFIFLVSKSSGIEPKEKNISRLLDEDDYSDDTTNLPGNSTGLDPNIKEQLQKIYPTKPALLGFGNIKPKKAKDKLVKFTIYFKNVKPEIMEKIFLEYIYFGIVSKGKTLRELPDVVDYELINGTLNQSTLLKDSDSVEYNVDTVLKDSFESFEILNNFKFVNQDLYYFTDEEKDLIKHELNSATSDVSIMPYLDLKNITETQIPLIFNVFELKSLGSLEYKIKGGFSKQIIIKNNTLIFHYNDYIDDYETIRTFIGTLKEISSEKKIIH